MLTNSKRYKIEKIIHSLKTAGITNICELYEFSHHHTYSIEESIYFSGAILIPYTEMLEHINYYNNTGMEETTEMFWLDRLAEQYKLSSGFKPSVNDVITRFKSVEKLSKSLFYKKRLEELYGINGDKDAKSNRESVKSLVLTKASKK